MATQGNGKMWYGYMVSYGVVLWYGMVWYDMVCYCGMMVWWYGMVWYGGGVIWNNRD